MHLLFFVIEMIIDRYNPSDLLDFDQKRFRGISSLMKGKHATGSNDFQRLTDQFSQRINRNRFFCLQFSHPAQTKLERLARYCQQQGFLWNRSTIDLIRTSLATMIARAFDQRVEHTRSHRKSDIQLQFTHVNALPSRTERGLFLIIELGSIVEDIRYSLVLLLGKQVPSYEILHSRGYDLPESIRKSYGTRLIDHLTLGLKEFLDQVRTENVEIARDVSRF